MYTCIECRTPLGGWHNSQKCGACRTISAYRDSAKQELESLQEMRREAFASEKRVQSEIAESEYRVRSMIAQQQKSFTEQTEKLIAEQQKTQQLLQEQHVTPQMAYDNGYNLFKIVKEGIDLNLDTMEWHLTFDTNKYLTEILQKEYQRGYTARLYDALGFSKSETGPNCYFAGTKGWDNFFVPNMMVDCCEVKAVWKCDLRSDIAYNGYISYTIADKHLLDNYLVSEYKRGLDEFQAAQNTPELIEKRITERKIRKEQQRARNKQLEAESLANEQKMQSEREFLAKQHKLQQIKDVSKFIFWGVIILAGLYFLFPYVLQIDHAVLSSLVVCFILGFLMYRENGIFAGLITPIIMYVPAWVFIKAFFFP